MLQKLKPFLPPNALPVVESMLDGEPFHLVITRPRKTKLGDFKPPHKHDEVPKLSVNGNLNPYAFLITLVHEIAHLKVWNAHKNRVKPHGNEWKNEYGRLLQQCIEADVFPLKIKNIVADHAKKPGYSSASDAELTIALRKFDEPDNTILLREMKLGDIFVLQQRRFKIEEKLRTRYLCTEMDSGKKYRVHGMAQVEPLHSHELG